VNANICWDVFQAENELDVTTTVVVIPILQCLHALNFLLDLGRLSAEYQ